ncbi:nucleoside hydrolase [Nocardia abscessus]|uniref:nucleoside hydrolase n=1 Tax=Nocardia abscessus TaxID=120957 RepID=UPI0024580B56|nr:nucleoside hydrolase [Nocardia abscessus]
MRDRKPMTAPLNTPLIVASDQGGDPDDALTLALLAMTEPRLELVITADELPDWRRAKFTRHLLALLGRDDVQVVAGHVLGESKYWAADRLYPADTPVEHADVYEAVAAVCGRVSTPVRYLGLGPLTDLAHVLDADSHHPNPLQSDERLRIWQMGGALNYRRPDKAEHNFRLDPQSVHAVMRRAKHLSLVMSDHTFVPDIEVDTDSPVYQLLAASPAPWAQLIRQHLDQWILKFHPSSKMHDPLTMTAAIGLPFVSFKWAEFHLAPDARMSPGADFGALLSTGADYETFVAWVLTTLHTGKPARVLTRDQAMGERATLDAGDSALDKRRHA